MLSLEAFHRIMRQHAEEAKKPFGMRVAMTFQDDPDFTRTDHWDLRNKAELTTACNKLCENFKSKHAIVKLILSPRVNRKDQKAICLPSNGMEIVLKTIEKMSSLTEVVVPNSFFTKNQRKRLDNLLKRNIESAEAAKREAQALQQMKLDKTQQRNRLQNGIWSFLGALSGVTVATVASFSFPLFVGVCLLGSTAGFFMSLGRQSYLQKASSYYDQPNKIIKQDYKVVSEAFRAGIESQYWPGYFKSYLNSATYLHPVAFAAAMNHAMQENDSVVKKMKKLSCC